MANKTCKTCRYWEKEDRGLCMGLTDDTRKVELDGFEVFSIEDAIVRTAPDFYCALWEKRP